MKEKEIIELKGYALDDQTGEVIESEKHLEKVANEIQNQLSIVETNPDLVKKTLTENKELARFIKEALQQNVHWQQIRGIDKPVILQGAIDLLSRVFSLHTKYEIIDKTIDITNNLIDYDYRANLYHRNKRGQEVYILSADASCGSLEYNQRSKFQKYTNGKWENLPNKSVFDVKNSVMQMAQKRAEMRAVRKALGIAGMFTQDMDKLQNPQYTTAQHVEKQKGVYNHAYSTLKEFTPKDIKSGDFVKEQVRNICDKLNISRVYKEWDTVNCEDLMHEINILAEQLKGGNNGK